MWSDCKTQFIKTKVTLMDSSNQPLFDSVKKLGLTRATWCNYAQKMSERNANLNKSISFWRQHIL